MHVRAPSFGVNYDWVLSNSVLDCVFQLGPGARRIGAHGPDADIFRRAQRLSAVVPTMSRKRVKVGVKRGGTRADRPRLEAFNRETTCRRH